MPVVCEIARTSAPAGSIFRISDPLIVVLLAISPSGCKKYQTSLNSPVVGAFRDVCKESRIMAVPNIYLYENGKCYDTSILINRDGQIPGIQKMVHVTQAD